MAKALRLEYGQESFGARSLSGRRFQTVSFERSIQAKKPGKAEKSPTPKSESERKDDSGIRTPARRRARSMRLMRRSPPGEGGKEAASRRRRRRRRSRPEEPAPLGGRRRPP